MTVAELKAKLEELSKENDIDDMVVIVYGNRKDTLFPDDTYLETKPNGDMYIVIE